MKIISTLILVLVTSAAYSQSEITANDLLRIKADVEKHVTKLRKDLETGADLSIFQEKTEIDFKIDTFRIERLMIEKTSIDYSTMGMVNAARDAEADYDKLLNKYYKILRDKLNETDKAILVKSQKNWIAFRDAERELNGQLTKEEYTGGGTMHYVAEASAYMNITKTRVIELYQHLQRFTE